MLRRAVTGPRIRSFPLCLSAWTPSHTPRPPHQHATGPACHGADGRKGALLLRFPPAVHAHGLPTVQHISSHVAVMYLGRIVEMADKVTLFSHPMHPYTEGLMAAVPIPDPAFRTDAAPLLEGDMPSPTNLPEGCRFHPRCKYCQEKCRHESPELRDVGNGHLLSCHYPLENAEGILR